MHQKAKFSSRSVVVPLVVMALALVPAIVAASGSITAHAPSNENFSRGKALYMERVVCASCPAPNGASNADEARALIARLDDEDFKLSARQRRAVQSYLNRRFSIKG